MVTIRYRHGKDMVLERHSTKFRTTLDMRDSDAQYVSERADYFQPATWLAVDLFQGGGAS
jgi:hypothetical protein